MSPAPGLAYLSVRAANVNANGSRFSVVSHNVVVLGREFETNSRILLILAANREAVKHSYTMIL